MTMQRVQHYLNGSHGTLGSKVVPDRQADRQTHSTNNSIDIHVYVHS